MMPKRLMASPASTIPMRPPTEAVKVRLATLIRKPSSVITRPAMTIPVILLGVLVLTLDVLERLGLDQHHGRTCQERDADDDPQNRPIHRGARRNRHPSE